MIETFVMVKHPSGHSNRSVKVEIFSKEEIQEICRQEIAKGATMRPLKPPPPKPPKIAPPIVGSGILKKSNITSSVSQDVQSKAQRTIRRNIPERADNATGK